MVEKVCSECYVRFNVSSIIEVFWEIKDFYYKMIFWSLKFVYLCIFIIGYEICFNILFLNSRLFRIYLVCEVEIFMLRGCYFLIYIMFVKLDMSKYLCFCLFIWDDVIIEFV